uniref:Nuclear protein MDM1 n=1 Tax=Timema monikensis TaxID=170555 RepID=A0A7R9E9X9_9NEOP|nr:unnamed protein product [Timema monikensis]
MTCLTTDYYSYSYFDKRFGQSKAIMWMTPIEGPDTDIVSVLRRSIVHTPWSWSSRNFIHDDTVHIYNHVTIPTNEIVRDFAQSKSSKENCLQQGVLMFMTTAFSRLTDTDVNEMFMTKTIPELSLVTLSLSRLKTSSEYACGLVQHRGWGTELVPQHIAELYNKQMILWEQVSRRSSLSALSLASTTPSFIVKSSTPQVRRYTKYMNGMGQFPMREWPIPFEFRSISKEEKEKENNKKSSPTKPAGSRLVSAKPSTTLDKSLQSYKTKVDIGEDTKKDLARSRKDFLIRHHLERTTGAGDGALLTSPIREKLEPVVPCPKTEDLPRSPKKASPKNSPRSARSQSVGPGLIENRSPKRQMRTPLSAHVPHANKEELQNGPLHTERRPRPRYELRFIECFLSLARFYSSSINSMATRAFSTAHNGVVTSEFTSAIVHLLGWVAERLVWAGGVHWPDSPREHVRYVTLHCLQHSAFSHLHFYTYLATNAPSRLKGSSSGPPTLSHQSLPKSKVLPGSALQGAKLRGERTQIGNIQDDSVGTIKKVKLIKSIQGVSMLVVDSRQQTAHLCRWLSPFTIILSQDVGGMRKSPTHNTMHLLALASANIKSSVGLCGVLYVLPTTQVHKILLLMSHGATNCRRRPQTQQFKLEEFNAEVFIYVFNRDEQETIRYLHSMKPKLE